MMTNYQSGYQQMICLLSTCTSIQLTINQFGYWLLNNWLPFLLWITNQSITDSNADSLKTYSITKYQNSVTDLVNNLVTK